MTKLEKQLKEIYGIKDVLVYVESMRVFEDTVKEINPSLWESAWGITEAVVS